MDLAFNFSLIFALGLLQGSFVGLCAYRLPRGLPVVFGFSQCDFCRAPLQWWQKIPLIGYLLLHGRSRCCHRKIPVHYPVLELGMGIIFLLLFRRAPGPGPFVAAILFVGFLSVGLLTDLSHKIIPDRVTLGGIGLGLAGAIGLHTPPATHALLGLLSCSGYLFIGGLLAKWLFRKPEAMGGGDIKFAAMIGTFLGLELGLLAVILAALLASLFGLFQLIQNPEFRKHRELKLGPFLALGAFLALIWGNPLIHWYMLRI